MFQHILVTFIISFFILSFLRVARPGGGGDGKLPRPITLRDLLHEVGLALLVGLTPLPELKGSLCLHAGSYP